MQGLYLLPFPLQGHSGKNRATRQKTNALATQLQHLIVISPSSTSWILRPLELLYNEISASYLIIKKKPCLDFIITRGVAGFLSIPVARLYRTTTLREVHAIPSEEARLIKGNPVKKTLARLTALATTGLTRLSQIRVFNHPSLLRYFDKKGWLKKNDFFCYNGGAPEDALDTPKETARTLLGLPQDKKILAFIGSACPWHGVDALVAIEKELKNKRQDTIVVCGGGDVSPYDPERRLKNITPLDSEGCAKLIRASDACLLPVNDIRVSPGSPLKLYDYALNGRPIITQQGVTGYEDEVKTHKIGVAVDFNSPETAAEEIHHFLDSNFEMPSPQALAQSISWQSRMRCWLRNAFDDDQHQTCCDSERNG